MMPSYKRDHRICYICGMGTGICDACTQEHLGGVNPGDNTIILSPVKKTPLPVLKDTVIYKGFEPPELNEDAYDVTREAESVDTARSAGMLVLYGAPDLLLLDLDNVPAHDRFRVMRPMVEAKVGITRVNAWHSKSGAPHVHVAVGIRTHMPVLARCALQGVLGSDPKREVFNVVKHVVHGVAEPSLLFQPKVFQLRSNWDGYDWLE